MKHAIFILLVLVSYPVTGMNGGKKDYTPNDPTRLSPPPSPTKRKKIVRPSTSVNVTVSPSISSSHDTSVATTARTQNEITATTQADAFLKSVTKQYKKYYPKARDGLYNNLSHIGIGLCVAGVGYLYQQFLAGNRYLQDQTRWSLFKQELPVRSLEETPASTLADELLLTIHRTYISQDNPLNTIEPMAKFLQEIEQETQQLTYYYTLYSWAKRAYLHRIIPAKPELYEAIPARLKRLALLKEIFIGWASQMKTRSCCTPHEFL